MRSCLSNSLPWRATLHDHAKEHALQECSSSKRRELTIKILPPCCTAPYKKCGNERPPAYAARFLQFNMPALLGEKHSVEVWALSAHTWWCASTSVKGDSKGAGKPCRMRGAEHGGHELRHSDPRSNCACRPRHITLCMLGFG